MGSPRTTKFLSGYDSIEVSLEPGSPPSKLFYSPTHPEINDFEIAVRLKNKGASNALGAVYIIGYDPFILEIENSTPPSSTIFCGIGSWVDLLQHVGVGVQRGSVNIGFRCREESTTISIRNEENFEIRDLFGALGEILSENEHAKKLGELFNIMNLDIKRTNGKWDFVLNFDFDLNSSEKYLYGQDMVLALNLERLTEGGFGKGFCLEGDNRLFPGGDEDVVSFKARVKNLPQNAENTYTGVLVDVIYGYTTFASTDICIDPSPYRNELDVCKMTTTKRISGGQGAPVEVYQIDQEYARTAMLYTIHVRHRGKGRVIDIDALKKAPYKDLLQEYDLNKVKIAKMWIGNTPLNPLTNCDNEGVIYLDERGEGFITCHYDITDLENAPAFTTPISIELWYGYEQILKRDITIRKTS